MSINSSMADRIEEALVFLMFVALIEISSQLHPQREGVR